MSLYNEVRPDNLTEVKGQEKIVAQIRAIIDSGNIPNVSLFVGPRGTGKTTVARIFAKAVNCNTPSADQGPCGICTSCKEITSGNSLDVIELDAASNNKVEDVHNLINSSGYTPLGKYKVYIIDEVHMLSTAAFNALLKLLEEPPAHCRFVLCTTEEHKVPVTILSRCRKFYFERINSAVITEKMKAICENRNISYEEEALRLIAKKSEGCMRDAESLLEIFLDAGNVSLNLVSDILGTTNEEIIWDMLHSVASGNTATAMSLIKEVNDKGKNLQVFLRSIIEALSDLVYYHQAKDITLIDNTTLYKQKLQTVSDTLSMERALEMASDFSDIFLSVLKGGDINFLLEMKLLTSVNTQTLISTLQQKIECLEDTLFSGTINPVISSQETSEIPAEQITDPKQEASTENVLKDNQPSKKNEEIENDIITSFAENTPDGSILPGDIFIPEGTEIKGTVSLFSDEDFNEKIDKLPIRIDGFKHISAEEEQDIPWNNSDSSNPADMKKSVDIVDAVDKSVDKPVDRTVDKSIVKPPKTMGIPTFDSFLNNFFG